MEQTLEEKLYDLQLLQARRLVFCNLAGNDLGEPYFQIDWMMTAGGEQFRFCEIVMGMTGSGIYFPDRRNMVGFAQNRVAQFLTTMKPFKPNILDADWHKDGILGDADWHEG